VPTKRKYRQRTKRKELSPTTRAFLWDEPLPADYDKEEFRWLRMDHGNRTRDLWYEHRERILYEWLETKAGSRPHLWWEHDAPRQQAVMQGRPFNLEVAVPRTRLGGTGTPAFEVMCLMPMYRYGVPAIWLDESMAAGCKRRRGGRFQGNPVDLNDPPIFEPEATYLKHHGLLFPGEEAHLAADSFEPEAFCNRHFAFHVRVSGQPEKEPE